VEIEEFQANLGNLLNQRWGELLGQSLVKIEKLEFQLSQQTGQIEALSKKIEDLKLELHQTQIDLVSTRSKSIISGALE
jgi:uncharacterized coiled-coil protein SlyX